jgi:hypothetical protein
MSWKFLSAVLVLIILSLLAFLFAVSFLGLGVMGIQVIKKQKQNNKKKTTNGTPPGSGKLQEEEKKLQTTNPEEKKPNVNGNNNNNNNGNGTLVPVPSKPVVGTPYAVPKLTSVYHPTGTLPAKVGSSTKAANAAELIWTTNIFSTHQQHGPIDFIFIMANITRCRGVKFHRNPPPDYAKAEKEFRAALPEFQDLLQKLSNGHSSIGKVEIMAMDLACATDFNPNDWCHKEFYGWNKQVNDALDAKTPKSTIFAVYTPEVQSCWGGFAAVGCRSWRNPNSRCYMFLNTVNSKIFIHELGHNLGDGHSVGDPMCIMGPGSEYINAYTMYMNGWLDNAEFVELDQICREGGTQAPVRVNLRPDSKHGIVLYLAVAVFSAGTGKHTDIVPLPFCTIVQRTFSNGENLVLMHTVDPNLSLPPVYYGMVAPEVHKLGHLDRVGSKYTLDTSRAQNVPLAFTYSNTWNSDSWSATGASSLASLGFTATARAKLLNLEITLTEKSATGAVVTLSRVP